MKEILYIFVNIKNIPIWKGDNYTAMNNVTYKIDKLAKNIVVIVSTVILSVFVIISLLYITTVKNFSENVLINLTTGLELIIYLAIDFIIIILIKAIERKEMLSNKIKLVAIATAIIFYSIISLLWVNSSNIQPVDDSGAVNYLAICFAKRRYGNNKK